MRVEGQARIPDRSDVDPILSRVFIVVADDVPGGPVALLERLSVRAAVPVAGRAVLRLPRRDGGELVAGC